MEHMNHLRPISSLTMKVLITENFILFCFTNLKIISHCELNFILSTFFLIKFYPGHWKLFKYLFKNKIKNKGCFYVTLISLFGSLLIPSCSHVTKTTRNHHLQKPIPGCYCILSCPFLLPFVVSHPNRRRNPWITPKLIMETSSSSTTQCHVYLSPQSTALGRA